MLIKKLQYMAVITTNTFLTSYLPLTRAQKRTFWELKNNKKYLKTVALDYLYKNMLVLLYLKIKPA